MNVLHVHSGNLSGGVETLLTTLARCRSLVPAMKMSAALCFDGELAAQLRSAGVATHMLGQVRLRRPDSMWRARRRLAELLEAGTYDVVVCHQSWPHVIFGALAKRARVPEVLWVHMAQSSGHWLDRLARRVQPDLVIANSRFTASTLGAMNAPVDVVYPPVTTNFEDVAQSRIDVRRALRTPRDHVVIVQVSRMEPLKGQRVCLAALARLRSLDGWTCWQVGGPQTPIERQYFEELQEDARQLGIAGRVRFIGQRSDVHALLRAADIFCQPNLAPEGFGIGFVEAMSSGLPVITSAIGAALEIVDGSCGVLTTPDDVETVAAAIGGLVENRTERERLGAGGREKSRTLCDPSEQMLRLAAAFDNAVRAKTKPAERNSGRGSRAAL
jgi:glycosyltransferase involved in cell wall biosynthesis